MEAAGVVPCRYSNKCPKALLVPSLSRNAGLHKCWGASKRAVYVPLLCSALGVGWGAGGAKRGVLFATRGLRISCPTRGASCHGQSASLHDFGTYCGYTV